MIVVEFLGPISRENLEVDVKNFDELKNILIKDDEIAKWLEISAVALNDKIVSNLDENLKDGDKISILPPVCGG